MKSLIKMSNLIQKIIKKPKKLNELNRRPIRYTATPIFPNEEYMKDALKRL